MGRHEDSKAAFATALERDPRSVIGQVIAAMAAFARNDTVATINALAAARAVDRSGIASFLSVMSLLGVGDTATARVLMIEQGMPSDRILLLTTRLRDPSVRNEVLRILDPPAGQGDNMTRANNRVLVGDLAGALDYFERAVERHEFNLPHALRNPFMAPVYADPRFRRIVAWGWSRTFPPRR